MPGDIAVAGFNNDAVSTIIDPALTTINYSGMMMGEKAATLLMDQLNGNSINGHSGTVVMPSELIIRESSLKKRKKK